MRSVSRTTLTAQLTLLLLLAGCVGHPGQDGEDGEAWIAYTWETGPIEFYSNDPGLPPVIVNGQYYHTSPGTYFFNYLDWQGTTWSGEYTIWINHGQAGEAGGWFRSDGEDGADGVDTCFELLCLDTGPQYSGGDCEEETFTTTGETARVMRP